MYNSRVMYQSFAIWEIYHNLSSFRTIYSTLWFFFLINISQLFILIFCGIVSLCSFSATLLLLGLKRFWSINNSTLNFLILIDIAIIYFEILKFWYKFLWYKKISAEHSVVEIKWEKKKKMHLFHYNLKTKVF